MYHLLCYSEVKRGPVAQLGARFHGMEEVVSSNLTRSTKRFQTLTVFLPPEKELTESKWSPNWTPGPSMSPGSAPIVTPDFVQLLFC